MLLRLEIRIRAIGVELDSGVIDARHPSQSLINAADQMSGRRRLARGTRRGLRRVTNSNERHSSIANRRQPPRTIAPQIRPGRLLSRSTSRIASHHFLAVGFPHPAGEAPIMSPGSPPTGQTGASMPLPPPPCKMTRYVKVARGPEGERRLRLSEKPDETDPLTNGFARDGHDFIHSSLPRLSVSSAHFAFLYG
uniref:Uncharacterized protein n=1 Tax=Plectus sambesii TaxID=2011161 RepID=A0A914VDU3_9BILA